MLLQANFIQSIIVMDEISLNRLQQLHPKLRHIAIEAYTEAYNALAGPAKPRVTLVYRTFEQQQALYNQGRTTPGPIVTNAKAGESYHCYRLSFDFCLLIDGKEISWNVAKDYDKDGKADWMEVVWCFVKRGFTWGADWDGDGVTKAQGDKDEKLVDAPHLQMTFGYHWRDLLAMHNAGKLDKDGNVLI